MVVGVACIFSWYWLADLCQREKIPFVLGHALYRKAIHGGKTKNDRIDSRKIAGLLRASMFPQADVYPRAMRATRDLLRRRTFLVRTARTHDPQAPMLLQTIHGMGKTLALVILYKIQDIRRFPRVQDFASCPPLVRCPKESAWKRRGTSGRKIGTAHLT